jgi:hypothetical protein
MVVGLDEKQDVREYEQAGDGYTPGQNGTGRRGWNVLL